MSMVTDHLMDVHVRFEVVAHDRAFTALEEARASGVSSHVVLKTVVVRTEHGDVAAVIPAARKLDMHRLRTAVGDPHARLATEGEIREEFPGFELGALPPLGSVLGLPLYVDAEVLELHRVVFADGAQTRSIRTSAAELFATEPLTLARLTADHALDEEIC